MTIEDIEHCLQIPAPYTWSE